MATPSDSPLDRLSAGEHATTAFELLSDETRLAILVTLWEHYEPFSDDTAMRFSELRERVGTADSGQFNYHLDRLGGYFVASTDSGYRLTETGLTVVRSVIAGVGIEEPTLEPTPVDIDCKLCGGTVTVEYRDGHVLVTCTECSGLWTDGNDHPEGNLAKFSLDPAGLTDRSADELYAAAWVSTFQRLYSMLDGVCPACSGPVERSLVVCDDHDPDGLCPNCERHLEMAATLRCPVCKLGIRTPVGSVAKYHPAFVAFWYHHGLTLQFGFNDPGRIEQRLELAGSRAERIAEDPLRVKVTAEVEGDDVWLVLDERLDVVDVGTRGTKGAAPSDGRED